MGAQPLYEVAVDLEHNGKPIDHKQIRIGLRTITLLAKSSTRPLGIAVNGRPFFARGANWVPSQQFLDTVKPAMLHKLVFAAKACNMNMFRGWGGGYYEGNDFYNDCDEAGILVWMDFKFASSAYPTRNPAFMANLKAEFQDNIKRLRHHPSIAVWSGNSEVHGIVTGYKIMSEADYDALFHVMLRNQVMDLVPHAVYVPGSPEAGDIHDWWVWHIGQPFAKYLDAHGLLTEFGFQSYPVPRTVDSYTEPSDRTSVFTPAMKSHEKNGNGRGSKMIVDMIDRYFNKPKDFNSTLWLSQIDQAMGMTLGVDHWRTDWPNSTGSLVWQYDDTWPGPSWSCIDYYGRWKAVMYLLKHDYAPLLVWGYADPHTSQVQVKVASGIAHPVSATLDWTLTNLAGKRIDSGNKPVHIGPGTTSVVAWNHAFQPTLDTVGRRNALLWLNLMIDGRSMSSQTVLFDKPKELRLMDPHLSTHIQPAGNGYDVMISAAHPALYVWLNINADANYSDNFVDIAGGKSIKIHVTPDHSMSAEQFHSALKVRSLYDTYDQSEVKATSKPLEQTGNGKFVATAATAEIIGDSAVLEKGNPPDIGNWTDTRDFLQWRVHVARPGIFRVTANTALPGNGGPYTVSIDGRHVQGTVPNTGGWGNYTNSRLGTVHISQPGDYALILRPNQPNMKGNVMNFRSLTFAPIGTNN